MSTPPQPPRPSHVRILIVEDNAADAALVERESAHGDLTVTARRVQEQATFVTAMRDFQPDVVLADYRLPRFSGLDAIRLAAVESPHTPVIIVTGTLDEERAAECIKQGAADYLLKDRLARLPTAVRGAVALRRSREEQARAAAALRASERRFRALIEHSADAIALFDRDGTILYGSPATTRTPATLAPKVRQTLAAG